MLGKRMTDRLHAWERFRPRLILVAVPFVLTVGFFFVRWGMGTLVATALFLTPEDLPRLIDDSHLAFADEAWASQSRLDPQQKLRVMEVFEQVTAVAPEARFSDYRLVFRDMPDLGPNSIAFPGGTVLLTDQFVRAFPDPDVIAGVIGHELIHVSEAHGLKQIFRSLGTYLSVIIVLGDVGPVLSDMLLEGGPLFSLAYSREFEREADRLGTRLAAKAGYDPGALIDLLRHFDERNESSGPEWLATHPDYGDRIAEIENLVDEFKASSR